ncbi:Cytochrome c-type biogenesis protein CcmE homolog, mitochondrial [Linum perenne]
MEGRLLLAFTMNLGCCSITRAELRGAIEGLSRTWDAGFRKVVLQVDSKTAISLMTSGKETTHHHGLESIKLHDLLNRDWTVKVLHTYREGNHAADFLANLRSAYADSKSISGRCFFSTARRYPTRPKPVDIGARARQLQTKRLWTYALAFSCVAGFIVIILNNFQDQMVFYVTPTDAMEQYKANPKKTKFRLGGLVLEGKRKLMMSTDVILISDDSEPEEEQEVSDYENPDVMLIKKDLANYIVDKRQSMTEDLIVHDEISCDRKAILTLFTTEMVDPKVNLAHIRTTENFNA